MFESFLRTLRNESWSEVYDTPGDIGSKYDIFANTLKYYFDKYFPLKEVTNVKNQIPDTLRIYINRPSLLETFTVGV